MQISLFFSYLAGFCFSACKNCNMGAATASVSKAKNFLFNIFLTVFAFLLAKIIM